MVKASTREKPVREGKVEGSNILKITSPNRHVLGSKTATEVPQVRLSLTTPTGKDSGPQRQGRHS